MSKRKYKLEVGGCTSTNIAIGIIADGCKISLKEASKCFNEEKIEADPEDKMYPEMINSLDAVGVEVYDLERVQIPKPENFTNEQPCYT